MQFQDQPWSGVAGSWVSTGKWKPETLCLRGATLAHRGGRTKRTAAAAGLSSGHRRNPLPNEDSWGLPGAADKTSSQAPQSLLGLGPPVVTCCPICRARDCPTTTFPTLPPTSLGSRHSSRGVPALPFCFPRCWPLGALASVQPDG